MALINYPTPAQLAEISDRFTQHHHDIENIIVSVNSDMECLFPPFTGNHPEEEHLKNVLLRLQQSSDTLQAFSNLIKQGQKAINTPDEPLVTDQFR